MNVPENAAWIEHYRGFSYAVERLWNDDSAYLDPKEFLETSGVSLFGLLNAFDRGLHEACIGRTTPVDTYLKKEIAVKTGCGEIKNPLMIFSTDSKRTVAIVSFDSDGFLTYRIYMISLGNKLI